MSESPIPSKLVKLVSSMRCLTKRVSLTIPMLDGRIKVPPGHSFNINALGRPSDLLPKNILIDIRTIQTSGT